jgi:hypothetical protein
MVEIRQLTDKSELGELHGFLSRASGRPYAYHRDIPAAKLSAHIAASISPFTHATEEKGCFVAYAGGEPKAVLCWQKLDWDSEILGFGAGKIGPVVYEGGHAELIDIMGAMLDKSLARLSRVGVRHITARVFSDQLVAIHSMESRRFQLMDSILWFAFDFSQQELAESPHSFEILPASREHHDGIIDVAQRSFMHDRFHSDPYISQEGADTLHRRWLQNLLVAEDASVLAAIEGADVLGFTAGKVLKEASKHLGLRLGVWTLMAAIENQRKRGLGHALAYETLRHFAAQCDMFEGGTQCTNTPSARAFLAAGYKYVSSSFTLRRWIE